MPLIKIIKGYSEQDLQQEYDRGYQQGRAHELDDLQRELAGLDLELEKIPPVLLPLRTSDIRKAIARRRQSDQADLARVNYENRQLQQQIDQLRADLDQTSIPQLREQIDDLQIKLSTARQQLTARLVAQTAAEQAQAARLAEIQRECDGLRTERDRQDELLVKLTARLQPQQQKR
jgi:hypothetical protein